MEELKAAFENGDWYQYLIPAIDSLADFTEIQLDLELERDIRCGRAIQAEAAINMDSAFAKAVSLQGELVAVLQYDAEAALWKPKKVLIS